MTSKLHFPRHIRRKQGGWAALPYIIATVGVAGAGVSAYSSIEQGKAASNQAKAQARAEGDSAKQQQIDRRRQLLTALASQNAAAGAGGIETNGSVAAGVRTNIRDNSNDLLVIGANNSARQQALREQASNATFAGNLGAASSLLDAAPKAYSILK